MIDELETRLWMEYWLSPREAAIEKGFTAGVVSSEMLRPQHDRFLQLLTLWFCYKAFTSAASLIHLILLLIF